MAFFPMYLHIIVPLHVSLCLGFPLIKATVIGSGPTLIQFDLILSQLHLEILVLNNVKF